MIKPACEEAKNGKGDAHHNQVMASLASRQTLEQQ
jgi:hypothetical protein